jgi:hypothetical protein
MNITGMICVVSTKVTVGDVRILKRKENCKMEENESKLFTLMVVSDTPEEVIKKYDANMEVEPYIKFYYKDIAKYKKKAMKVTQDLIDNSESLGLTPFMKDYFVNKIKTLKKTSDFEYYTTISDGCTFDENGNALTTTNPNGKWGTCRIGRNLCLPLKLKIGTEALQARAGDVDWPKMHMVNIELYRLAWKLFHKEVEPKTEQEKQIYDNIKYQKRYFEGFDSEEDYVNYCCSYWCYAYADDDKWEDADDHKNYEWITTFYDKYIKNLKPDALVTIYECSKP